jgi:glucan phosphorylase
VHWAPEKVVKGVAYDTPVPGYRVHSANLLRLWKAEAAGTAREPAKSQVFSLASSIRPESMAEGVARIWW